MQLMTRDEAAQQLRVSVISLDRLRKAGKIPHRKIGGRVFFGSNDISDFLEACRVSAQATTGFSAG